MPFHKLNQRTQLENRLKQLEEQVAKNKTEGRGPEDYEARILRRFYHPDGRWIQKERTVQQLRDDLESGGHEGRRCSFCECTNRTLAFYTTTVGPESNRFICQPCAAGALQALYVDRVGDPYMLTFIAKLSDLPVEEE